MYLVDYKGVHLNVRTAYSHVNINMLVPVVFTCNEQCKGGPGLCSEVWTWVMG